MREKYQSKIIYLIQESGSTPKQVEGAFKRLLANKSKAESLIQSSFLSSEMQEKYLTVLNERFDRLFA